MAAYTHITREKYTAKVYFIKAGEVVDSVTVANATWPDASPVTNWTNYQLHDTETIKEERTYEKEAFKIGVGLNTEDEESTIKRIAYTGKTHKTSSLFRQLEFGLAAAPVNGTAQAPFVRHEDYIEGVVLIEFINKDDAITQRLQNWGRLRLKETGETGAAVREFTYEIELRASTANTYLPIA